ncbi:Uncharacterized protein PCOAH_00001570 [Plasmodium coatneyi]|uniref:Uncharacterized protein n=1 Tax=Plasmodium coatneyi TaxID=208452 RepID=A0A1B1DT59_9APIC|nr:Uncharacterized protein PCOAH_00001570 [Plasmodium coatneyi]ANQ05775.1 Uncharacterized protein PCOAH_00001570 [Plasmodium coatneyi]
MRKKKTLRRNARQIADHLKKIEQECSQLSKHIRRVEEERKSFEISTSLLKKYHSYVDSNLLNNGVPISTSSSVFVKSCGIIFSWKTILEDPDNATQDGCYSGYAESRHSDCVMGESHMIVEGAPHKRSKLLWREAQVGFSDVCSSPGGASPLGSNPISGKKSTRGATTFPRDGTSWSDCSGGTHGHSSGDLWNAEGEREKVAPGKNSQFLGQKVGRGGRSHEKKNSTVKPNRSYYSVGRETPHTRGFLHSFEEGTSPNGMRDDRGVANQLSHFTIARRNGDKKKCEISAASSLHPGDGQSIPPVGPHNGNDNNDSENDDHSDNNERERQDERGSADSYVDRIRKGKMFAFFTNKSENKYNPFSHFVNNVKRIFFFSEKEEEQNGRCTSDKEKSELMTSLKFKCLVKSKKIVMYACVCPHCEKHFYLLLKKSGRKKIVPRVLSPSQFAAMITLLREQSIGGGEGGIATGRNDIPHLDTHSIEYFSDSVMTPHEANQNRREHFCNCYVGMDEGDAGLFGDPNVLAYL